MIWTQAGPVRPGEELDTLRLEAYLREHLPGFAEPAHHRAVPQRLLQPDLPAADGRD